MKAISFSRTFMVVFFLTITGCAPIGQFGTKEKLKTASPEELYGDLFYMVQADTSLFPDSKTFVDAVPWYEADTILARYSRLNPNGTAALKIFVNDNFEIPSEGVTYQSDSSAIAIHISGLWEVLKRPAATRDNNGMPQTGGRPCNGSR